MLHKDVGIVCTSVFVFVFTFDHPPTAAEVVGSFLDMCCGWCLLALPGTVLVTAVLGLRPGWLLAALLRRSRRAALAGSLG